MQFGVEFFQKFSRFKPRLIDIRNPCVELFLARLNFGNARIELIELDLFFLRKRGAGGFFGKLVKLPLQVWHDYV